MLAAVAALTACGSTQTTSMNSSADTTAVQPVQTQNTDSDWQPLFDGKTTAGWHTYGKQTIGKAWKVEDKRKEKDA